MATYDKGRTLTVGGGLLFFKDKSAGADDAFVYFGPTENIVISTENEWLEHKSTEGCVSLVDKKISIGKTASITIDSTTINPSSLARAFQGTVTDASQVAVTDQAVVTDAVILGGVTDYGFVGATSVVVTDDSDATTYVDGVDYELVAKAGYVIPLVGGAIAEGDILHLTVSAPDFESVIVSAMKLEQLEGEFKFVTNSNTGNDYEYHFKNVNLTQSGDFGIKSNEGFLTINYEGSITIDSETPASSLSQFFDIKSLPSGCDSATVQ